MNTDKMFHNFSKSDKYKNKVNQFAQQKNISDQMSSLSLKIFNCDEERMWNIQNIYQRKPILIFGICFMVLIDCLYDYSDYFSDSK